MPTKERRFVLVIYPDVAAALSRLAAASGESRAEVVRRLVLAEVSRAG